MLFELFIGILVMPKKLSPEKIYSSHVLMHGFHGDPECYSPEGGVPTKTISAAS